MRVSVTVLGPAPTYKWAGFFAVEIFLAPLAKSPNSHFQAVAGVFIVSRNMVAAVESWHSVIQVLLTLNWAYEFTHNPHDRISVEKIKKYCRMLLNCIIISFPYCKDNTLIQKVVLLIFVALILLVLPYYKKKNACNALKLT